MITKEKYAYRKFFFRDHERPGVARDVGERWGLGCGTRARPGCEWQARATATRAAATGLRRGGRRLCRGLGGLRRGGPIRGARPVPRRPRRRSRLARPGRPGLRL